MINTEKFRIQQSHTDYDCCIVKTEDVYSLTPRHSEYNCRKVIYDSCIRTTAQFSGCLFRMKRGNSLFDTCTLNEESDNAGIVGIQLSCVNLRQ